MEPEHRSSLAMERRMAALFLLALALIVWQALRTKPLGPTPLEISTRRGEQLLPIAVPSWRSDLLLSRSPADRPAALASRALLWPGEAPARPGVPGCQLFLRISSQHWVRRSASLQQVRSWLDPGAGLRSPEPSRLLRLPAASFLDDDDADGDPLDAGELEPAGPGAEVEVFCGAASEAESGVR